MQSRSIDVDRPDPGSGWVAATLLAVALAACSGAATAQINRGEAGVASPIAGGIAPALATQGAYAQAGAAAVIAGVQPMDTIRVGLAVPSPEAWEGFERSVSGAAMSSCLGPDALSHRGFAVEGLLRLPFLVGAAAAGTCR